MTVDERVAQGAHLLDGRYPGWERDVNLATLDMESCTLCVLGQLYSGFFVGVEKLWGLPDGIPCWKDATAHAFDIDRTEVGHDGSVAALQMLTFAWRKEISRRLLEGNT